MKEIQQNFEIYIFFSNFKSDDRKTTDTSLFEKISLYFYHILHEAFWTN